MNTWGKVSTVASDTLLSSAWTPGAATSSTAVSAKSLEYVDKVASKVTLIYGLNI